MCIQMQMARNSGLEYTLLMHELLARANDLLGAISEILVRL
jgi:hypothetical protein